MGQLDKAQVEERRQRLLQARADCIQRMSPKARERFERGIAPAIPDEPDPAVVGPSIHAELPADNEELLNLTTSALLCIGYTAMNCGDRTNAVRAFGQIIRVVQLRQQSGGDLEEQQTRMGGFPVGPPEMPSLTDEQKTYLEEIKKLSPADRMLLREGYTARIRISELEAQAKREGRMSDLLREQPTKEEPKREESSMTVPVITKDEDGRERE